jgi:hypothetical protein
MTRLRCNRTLWKAALVVLGLGTIAACATLVKREDKIRFSHKAHVRDNGMDCADCHGDVIASDKVLPSMKMKEAGCLNCHEKSDDNCGDCHMEPVRPGTWTERLPTQGIKFSHRIHMAEENVTCDSCHAGVGDRTAPAPAARPMSHDTCMGCHKKDFRDIDCKACHVDIVENPARPSSVFSHDADFMARHGALSRGESDVCAHCHRPDSCADCHSRMQALTPSVRMGERVDRQLVHRGDFLTRHAIEARTDGNRCLSCHTTSQCSSCHDQRQIASKGPLGSRPSPHPAGWAMNRTSPHFHGDEARRDIVSCASCHDQGAASNCVTCHRVGGTAGSSPHPPGWKPTVGQDTRMCRSCHVN